MEYNVKNIVEELVKKTMPNVLASISDICHCERCDADRLAYVLNAIPAKYVVTQKGRLYAKLAVLEQQYTTDIITALTRAAEVVKANPSH